MSHTCFRVNPHSLFLHIFFFFLWMMVIAIKNAKGTKIHEIKQILKIIYYKNCLLNKEIELELPQRLKSIGHNIYTEKIKKIALNSKDNKRLKTFGNIVSCSYDTSVGKVRKREILESLNTKWLILIMLLIKRNQNIIQTDHIFQIIYTEY